MAKTSCINHLVGSQNIFSSEKYSLKKCTKTSCISHLAGSQKPDVVGTGKITDGRFLSTFNPLKYSQQIS